MPDDSLGPVKGPKGFPEVDGRGSCAYCTATSLRLAFVAEKRSLLCSDLGRQAKLALGGGWLGAVQSTVGSMSGRSKGFQLLEGPGRARRGPERQEKQGKAREMVKQGRREGTGCS